MKKDLALIVIDMQVGVFESSDIPPVFEAQKLLQKVSELIEKARNAAIPIIFVQHKGGKGHPLEHDTDGWKIHPDMGITNEDIIVQKHSPDSFYDTNLQDKLISNKIKRLIIAGIQTEFCIDTTCRRAFSLGYDVILANDAHGTWDTDQLKATQIIDHHNSLLSEWFVTLKSVNEVKFDQ